MGRKEKEQGPEIEWDSKVVYRYGFERLCSAVVAQAAKDQAWWFFESPAIKLYLSDRIDPIALERQIKDNYKNFGRWSAVDTRAVPWSGRLEGEEEL